MLIKQCCTCNSGTRLVVRVKPLTEVRLSKLSSEGELKQRKQGHVMSEFLWKKQKDVEVKWAVSQQNIALIEFTPAKLITAKYKTIAWLHVALRLHVVDPKTEVCLKPVFPYFIRPMSSFGNKNSDTDPKTCLAFIAKVLVHSWQL